LSKIKKGEVLWGKERWRRGVRVNVKVWTSERSKPIRGKPNHFKNGKGEIVSVFESK